MSVPAWATEFITNFYANVADVESPANYAAQFAPDGDLFMRAPFKGHAAIEQCMMGFWERVKAARHHGITVYCNAAQPDTLFANGKVDLENRDGTSVKDVEFVGRFTLDGERKIKSYRVWTCELAGRQGRGGLTERRGAVNQTEMHDVPHAAGCVPLSAPPTSGGVRVCANPPTVLH